MVFQLMFLQALAAAVRIPSISTALPLHHTLSLVRLVEARAVSFSRSGVSGGQGSATYVSSAVTQSNVHRDGVIGRMILQP